MLSFYWYLSSPREIISYITKPLLINFYIIQAFPKCILWYVFKVDDICINKRNMILVVKLCSHLLGSSISAIQWSSSKLLKSNRQATQLQGYIQRDILMALITNNDKTSILIVPLVPIIVNRKIFTNNTKYHLEI